MKVKIIIPIYNDWQSVFKLFEEINNLKIDKNFEISIIVVNDASNHDRPNEEVNFDNIQTISKAKIGGLITTLTRERLVDVGEAISFALGLDMPDLFL